MFWKFWTVVCLLIVAGMARADLNSCFHECQAFYDREVRKPKVCPVSRNLCLTNIRVRVIICQQHCFKNNPIKCKNVAG